MIHQLINITIYLKNLPDEVIITNQTMFLAFYRSTFMHSILPLEDAPGWIILTLIAVTGAVATAEFTRLQRGGKFGFELLVLVAAVLVYMPRELGYDISFILVVIVIVNFWMAARRVTYRLEGK